jgi:hypothetical protein
MEKWLVVAGIWTMCGMCAVLFIRGATRSVTREKIEEPLPSGSAPGVVQD